MKAIRIRTGPFTFLAQLEEESAPATCTTFRSMLPLTSKLIHARWSGEACWVPMKDLNLALSYENHTSFPSPGQVLFYSGGLSETEILLPYGGVRFASKVGQLAGNHFLTITHGKEHLSALGKLTLWQGAQDIVFDIH